MAEATLPVPPPRRLYFDLVIPTLIRPRVAFAQITGHNGVSWLTPMLILTITILLSVIVAGSIQQRAAANNLSPEQQTMIEQGASSAGNPTNTYVLPAIGRLGGLWLGWLVVGGILYLALTLLGGRGKAQLAW